MDYRGKNILAPMVRVSTLPMRLLALDCGADIIYCEEIIDFKLLECERVVNDATGTVDYLWKDNTIIFRTLPDREKDKLVFQIGTADGDRALQVAKIIEQDVAAIDVNMGCPKEFSIKGGMGAALLSQPEKVKRILTTLVNGLSIPVTCKIRILPTIEETIALVKVIESTGVKAVAIHGRLKEERPRHPNHDDIIAQAAKAVSIPVIANGGSNIIKTFEDIDKFRQSSGASSVMLARAAMWNPSIFSSDGLKPALDVIRQYLNYALRFESYVSNTKYCLQHLFRHELGTPRGEGLNKAISLKEICTVFDMEKEYNDEYHRKQEQASVCEPSAKRIRLENEVLKMTVKCERKLYQRSKISPKLILYEWTQRAELPQPVYESSYDATDKAYSSSVTVNGVKYASSVLNKSKKWGEQGAAVVYLRSLGLDEFLPLRQQSEQVNAALSKFRGSSSPSLKTVTSSGKAVTSSGNAVTTSGNAVTSSGNAVTSSGNAVTTSGNAMTSSGNAVTSSGNAVTSSGNAVTTSGSGVASCVKDETSVNVDSSARDIWPISNSNCPDSNDTRLQSATDETTMGTKSAGATKNCHDDTNSSTQACENDLKQDASVTFAADSSSKTTS